ncbi:MAG: chemotaxis response regulator protein-glutamate methylesterase, partial [Cyanobacteria bacterium J06560_2]
MPIRVLLVEDSPVVLAVLTKILQQSPQIEIVGAAHTGLEAL